VFEDYKRRGSRRDGVIIRTEDDSVYRSLEIAAERAHERYLRARDDNAFQVEVLRTLADLPGGDGYTTGDLVEILGKTRDYTSFNVHRLRAAGLVINEGRIHLVTNKGRKTLKEL
jgi:hypothetical protein